jgi:hypothetical protein
VTRRDGANIGATSWTDDLHRSYRRSSFGTWTNFDEAKANPFPLPDPLVLKNGQTVRDADTWWTQRRPEIVSDFFSEIYGKIPENTPRISWEVSSVDEVRGVKMKIIVGHIDNSAYPEAAPEVDLTLYVPANASGPVPVIFIVADDPRERGVPVNIGIDGLKPRFTGPPAFGSRMEGVLVGEQGRREVAQLVLARGWGFAFFNAGGVQEDSQAEGDRTGLTRGIIGLMNKGKPRSPDQWGELSAWAWGVNRCVDYLETDPDVDAKQLGVEGQGRYGRAALWAVAFDQRWAIVYAATTGEGGAKLHRRNYGDTVDNLVGSSWVAGNFRKYGGHWNDLPVDAHELIALVAPRPAFITGSTTDFTADSHGQFLAEVAAGPVYRLLGKNDLGTTEMPAPNVALISGELAFCNHADGGSDWPVFLEYASKYLKAPAAKN